MIQLKAKNLPTDVQAFIQWAFVCRGGCNHSASVLSANGARVIMFQTNDPIVQKRMLDNDVDFEVKNFESTEGSVVSVAYHPRRSLNGFKMPVTHPTVAEILRQKILGNAGPFIVKGNLTITASHMDSENLSYTHNVRIDTNDDLAVIIKSYENKIVRQNSNPVR